MHVLVCLPSGHRHTGAQVPRCPDAQMHERTNAQRHGRTDAQRYGKIHQLTTAHRLQDHKWKNASWTQLVVGLARAGYASPDRPERVVTRSIIVYRECSGTCKFVRESRTLCKGIYCACAIRYNRQHLVTRPHSACCSPRTGLRTAPYLSPYWAQSRYSRLFTTARSSRHQSSSLQPKKIKHKGTVCSWVSDPRIHRPPRLLEPSHNNGKQKFHCQVPPPHYRTNSPPFFSSPSRPSVIHRSDFRKSSSH